MRVAYSREYRDYRKRYLKQRLKKAKDGSVILKSVLRTIKHKKGNEKYFVILKQKRWDGQN